MNTIDFHVTEVLGLPYKLYSKWWVKVMANAYGRVTEETVMCNTIDEAHKVKIGYVFQG